jgi:hypothetical protein
MGTSGLEEQHGYSGWSIPLTVQGDKKYCHWSAHTQSTDSRGLGTRKDQPRAWISVPGSYSMQGGRNRVDNAWSRRRGQARQAERPAQHPAHSPPQLPLDSQYHRCWLLANYQEALLLPPAERTLGWEPGLWVGNMARLPGLSSLHPSLVEDLWPPG